MVGIINMREIVLPAGKIIPGRDEMICKNFLFLVMRMKKACLANMNALYGYELAWEKVITLMPVSVIRMMKV